MLPKAANSISITLGTPLNLLDYMAQVAEQPGSVAEPSAVVGLTQNEQFFRPFGKWAIVAHLSDECAASKIQKASRCYASFLFVGGAKCNNLSFPLEGLSQ
jgi:hypothetical protein